MLRAADITRYGNPLSNVAKAARRAAVREAEAQLAELDNIDLSRAQPHQVMVIKSWRRQLLELLEPRRRD